MKAQILDTQLETEEETGIAELLTEDKDNQVASATEWIGYNRNMYGGTHSSSSLIFIPFSLTNTFRLMVQQY